MEKIKYTIVRSSRKTVAIQVKPDGVVVRAPYRVSKKEIQGIVESKREWILKHMSLLENRLEEQASVTPFTADEIYALADQALKVIPEKVRHYASLIGVDYGRITIRNQKSRWGSCSGKGNLNFNCLLMLCPDEVIDSVVVHELCHRKYMDHSPAFYAEIDKVFPDYDRCHKWLKENGGAILRRLP